MINIVALATGLFGFLISIACHFKVGNEFALSSLFGTGVMVANLLGLRLIWKMFFSKKSIALVVSVIIFKYLILGLILLNLNQIKWMNPIGFVLGLSSLLFGILSSLVVKNYFTGQQK